MMMQMEEAAKQLLRALRGKRSQVSFSRRLGYEGNVSASWEAGRRFPTACEALRAATLVGVDVANAFNLFEPSCVPEGFGKAELAEWCDRLRGKETAASLSSRSSLSRDAVGRILRGQSEPRLPEFLSLVSAITGRVADLVARLADIDKIPALAEQYRLQCAARELAFAEPWSVPILRLIETETFQKKAFEPGRLALILGIDIETEQRCLEALCNAAVLTKDETTYRVLRALTVDARGQPDRLWELKRHWARTGADFVGQETPTNRFSYNLFSCSAADFERIRELQWQFYHQVRGIVASSLPVERVGLLNLQLVEWKD